MVAKPHGGKLVNKVSREPRRSRLLEEARELYQISLDLDTAVEILLMVFMEQMTIL